MSTATRTEVIETAALPGRRLSIDIPEDWESIPRDESMPESVLAVFGDARSLTPGFTTNVLLIAQSLDNDIDLASWQRRSLTHQRATLADLQVLEDRAVETDEGPAWYRSRLMTGDGPATHLVREWSRIVDGTAMTLTITTVPLVDGEHGALLDAIAASWRVEETEDAR